MKTRNCFRDFLFGSMIAVMLVGLQPAAMAADPTKPAPQQLADRDGRLCKLYLREHRGPPGKGMDNVRVVYVACSKKG